MSAAERRYTAFAGTRRIGGGSLLDAALAAKDAEQDTAGPLLVFDDATGRVVDVDTRGTPEQVAARLAERNAAPAPPANPEPSADAAPRVRRRGRPSLGVVAREVTLLPRHWEWLSAQPGGASVALRKLVEEARRTHADADRRRAAQTAAYHFLSAIAGDLAGFEEASRALFAGDRERFASQMTAWPADVRDHALTLAFPRDNP
ncbi:MAG TPA: DUF2239 family protein [Longimicrobium sp.]|uniref:DUF2239 family protein n=1 Tax=Longimicrobium sp. TaxID=2029185 RepID=UPI002ED99405